MREDDGVAFLAEALDFGAQVEAREILAEGSSHGISLYGLALAPPYTATRDRATRSTAGQPLRERDDGRRHRQKVDGEPHRDDNRRDRLRSEEHTSELQSLMRLSYAVF